MLKYLLGAALLLFLGFNHLSAQELSKKNRVEAGNISDKPKMTETIKPISLKPYTAEYVARFRNFNLSATRSLQHNKGQHWTLTNNFKHWLASISEVSQFHLNDTAEGKKLQSHDYRYKRSVLGKSKKIHLAMDHQKQILRENYDDRKSQLSPIPDQLYDSLNQHLQLRIDLLQKKPSPFIYPVYKKGRIKTYTYQLIGTEKIDTPAGQFNALKLSTPAKKNRQTTVWMALDWDLLILKIQHTEGKDSYTLALKQATLDKQHIGQSEETENDDYD